MNVKTLFAGLFVAVLFSSCDPNSDKQVGNSNRFANANTGSSSGGSGGGTVGSNTSSPTDAPLDGGLGILLLAGTAYGVKRVRKIKQAEKTK